MIVSSVPEVVPNIVTVGLDIAKQTFQVHGVDCKGKVVLRKRLRRAEVASFFAGLEPCLIGLEGLAVERTTGFEY
jgi:transposase